MSAERTPLPGESGAITKPLPFMPQPETGIHSQGADVTTLLAPAASSFTEAGLPHAPAIQLPLERFETTVIEDLTTQSRLEIAYQGLPRRRRRIFTRVLTDIREGKVEESLPPRDMYDFHGAAEGDVVFVTSIFQDAGLIENRRGEGRFILNRGDRPIREEAALAIQVSDEIIASTTAPEPQSEQAIVDEQPVKKTRKPKRRDIGRRLFDEILSRIQSGKPGDKLPTTRELQGLLDVDSRNLTQAWAILQEAGIIQVNRKKGTFVVANGDDEIARAREVFAERFPTPGEKISVSLPVEQVSQEPVSSKVRVFESYLEIIRGGNAGDRLPSNAELIRALKLSADDIPSVRRVLQQVGLIQLRGGDFQGTYILDNRLGTILEARRIFSYEQPKGYIGLPKRKYQITTLEEQGAYKTIQDIIRRGEPGDSLPTQAELEGLNLTRQSVRVALRALQESGFITIRDGVGAFIVASETPEAVEVQEGQLYIQIARGILTSIINGKYAEGERLSVRKLSEEFPVATGTLRKSVDLLTGLNVFTRETEKAHPRISRDLPETALFDFDKSVYDLTLSQAQRIAIGLLEGIDADEFGHQLPGQKTLAREFKRSVSMIVEAEEILEELGVIKVSTGKPEYTQILPEAGKIIDSLRMSPSTHN